MPNAFGSREDVLAESYEDLHAMVKDIAKRYALRYGVRSEDMVSQAHLIFVKACDSYNPKKGSKLSSWLYAKLGWGLVSFMRKEYPHLKTKSIESIIQELNDRGEPCDFVEPSVEPNNFLFELTSELSHDAQKIIELVIGKQNDFQRLCRYNRVNDWEKARESLHETLQDIGWEQERITERIVEIQRAMNNLSRDVLNEPKWSTVYQETFWSE